MKDWLRPWLEKHGKKADAVVLQHVTVSGLATVLLTIDVAPNDVTSSAWLDVQCEELEQAAQMHVETFPGQHRFVVALQCNGRTTAQRGFNANATADALAVAGHSEPASIAGVCSQLMRHIERREMINANVVTSALSAVETMGAELAARRSHEGMLQAQVMELFQAVARLHKIEASMKLEEDKATRAAAQKDRLLKQAERLVPVVLGQLTGTSAVAELMDSLPEDTLNGMLAAASPEVRRKLARVLKEQRRYDREKEAADEEAAAPPTTATTNGAPKNGAPS